MWERVRRVEGVHDSELKHCSVPEAARSSLHSFQHVPQHSRFGVFAARPGNMCGRSCNCNVHDGLLLFELVPSTGDGRRFAAIIHTMYVHPDMRSKGLGGSLLQHAHAMAACAVQQQCWSSEAHESVVEWDLARGSCRRRPDTLLCLSLHGWQVILDAEKTVDVSTIRTWVAEGKDVQKSDLVLRGPKTRVSRGAGCLSPAFPAGLAQFVTPDLMPEAPSHRRFKRSLEMCESARMSPTPFVGGSASAPSAYLGLKPFFVPLHACQLLESHLSESGNHSITCTKNQHGQSSLKHLFKLTASCNMVGYSGYSSLNGDHIPDMQQLRTLKTNSPEAVKHAIQNLPGLSELLLTAAEQMGLAVEEHCLHEHVLHLHFLYLDDLGQVDFNWHEDTFDLSIDPAKRDGIISVIVQLSTSFSTALQVYGFPYFEYKGQGCGVIFFGRCLHRTVSRQRVPPNYGVWKVAAFMHPKRSVPRNPAVSNVYDVE
jgi:GNAT superfamily N-acetyltransferase